MKIRKIGIIGGGISGLMAAYKLLIEHDMLEVVIYEKGNDISQRNCPIVERKSDICLKCPHCAIMEGLAGAGAFSDGKYNITTEFGGWLQDFEEDSKVLEYIEEADKILVSFGATKKRYQPSLELQKLCLQHDLHMLTSQCKHLGTDENFETMVKWISFMRNTFEGRLTIKTNTNVVDVEPIGTGRYYISYIGKDNENMSNMFTDTVDVVVFAVGRVGSKFFSDWCKKHKVQQKNNQVDIGVRVELLAPIWEEFERKIYEPKILYRSQKYGDVTRMFCFNGRGEVVLENTNGILTVNGHAYEAEEKKTKNTNFALLSTIKFTEPFNKPIEYARYVAGLANMISGGSVLVQCLGDLERGRRTDESRLRKSTVKPTLKAAVPGDLSLCMPKRQLDNILETLYALDKIAPGTANNGTLLYGIECKYFSARPEIEYHYQIKGYHNCFAIGDGAGFTRSLGQAAAHGLMIADEILRRSEIDKYWGISNTEDENSDEEVEE